jgi:chitin disaccharide deacetylase
MPRLIVNADDLGLTPGVNRGIFESHMSGIVTSATLMATGAAFDDAVQKAQAANRLSIGCHVMLVDGVPVLGRYRIPTLINSRASSRKQTFFRKSAINFGARALLGRISSDDIEAEASAQIRKLQSAGLSVSHIDTHKHTHLWPHVLQPLLQAAKSCGVKRIRNPFELAPLRLIACRPGLWKRYAQTRALSGLAYNFQSSVREAGFITPDGTLGIVVTGKLGDQIWRLMIDRLPEGTWELVCHPGYCDSELVGFPTRLRKSREQELQLLTRPAIRDLLKRNGIELLSYNDLN